MSRLEEVAPAFVEMAHSIVWCVVATVDTENRPWSRVLHPIWEWDGEQLTGWVVTAPTPLKRNHLSHSPHMSLGYWRSDHDTCSAEVEAEWITGDNELERLWDRFVSTPPPVGYDPSIIPGWDSPASPAFGGLILRPWRLRVMPGSVLTGQGGEVLTWIR